MPKYTEQDIVRGKRITTNGMIAGFVQVGGSERFRIIGRAPGFKSTKKVVAKKRTSAKKKTSAKKRVAKKPAMQTLNDHYKSSKVSAPKRKALIKQLERARAQRGGWENSDSEDDELSGGSKRPIELKTAVRLLRQYYETKYV